MLAVIAWTKDPFGNGIAEKIDKEQSSTAGSALGNAGELEKLLPVLRGVELDTALAWTQSKLDDNGVRAAIPEIDPTGRSTDSNRKLAGHVPKRGMQVRVQGQLEGEFARRWRVIGRVDPQ
jgi:hypothetical protein